VAVELILVSPVFSAPWPWANPTSRKLRCS